MSNLITDLLYMRELVEKRDEWNQMESELQHSMPEFHEEYAMQEYKASRAMMIIAIIYIAMIFFSTLSLVKGDTQRRFQNEELDQKLHAMFYEEDAAEMEPVSYQKIFISELRKKLFRAAVEIGIIVGIILMIRKIRKKAVKKRNMEIQQKNQQIQWANQRIAEERQQIADKLDEVRDSRRLIDSEISRNVEEWFPKGYDNEEAINYFITLLDTQRALNMQQAVRLYEMDIIGNRSSSY